MVANTEALISIAESFAASLRRKDALHILNAIAEIESLRHILVGADVGSNAARDVIAERRRQVEAEGWTPEHDDAHDNGELAIAAAGYATAAPATYVEREWQFADKPKSWPWHRSWWKPSFYRRNLVKAGALILAEIERLDRAAMQESAR